MTKRIIEALGLCNTYSIEISTPAESAALPQDIDGQPVSGAINYSSVVGMLLYLRHTCPDIDFAVHQCALYTFEPKQNHEAALKRIRHYLKGTMDKGRTMCPNNNYNVDCYPDAAFTGLWRHKHPQDPHYVRSFTSYIIIFTGCAVLWVSKLQTEFALSTMESEYITLSTSCKDLFPIMDLVREMGKCVGLPVNGT